jgi:hypothetical protein
MLWKHFQNAKCLSITLGGYQTETLRVRHFGIENMIKLTDAKCFRFFFLRWNDKNIENLFTRSKNGVEIELQQGTPECHIPMQCTFGA